MLNTEKVIKDVEERLSRAVGAARTIVSDAIAQLREEHSVLHSSRSMHEATGMIVREVELRARWQPTNTDPTTVNADLITNGYFARSDGGGSDRAQLGEQVLAPGKYRVIVLFYRKEG